YVLLSSMLRPDPPVSPLFPYTTLFRSPSFVLRGGRIGYISLPIWRNPHGYAPSRCHDPVPARGDRGSAQGRRFCRCGDRRSGRKDRKSTRLNSSHVKISYAVFCLKKKK